MTDEIEEGARPGAGGRPRSGAAFAGADHDHRACVSDAVAAAAALCRARGARLTELRQRVLELVWGSHEPVGAYDLLDGLAAAGRRAAPATIYRALDFLVSHGLVHRIESLNAFVGCPDPMTPHAGQFLICRVCGVAAELDDAGIGGAIAESASDLGFRVHQTTVEVLGTCPRCAPAEDPNRDRG